MRNCLALVGVAAFCAWAAAEEVVPVVADLPENPFGAVTRVADVGLKASCLLLDGDILYCGGDNALYVLDVTEPLAPRVRSVVKGLGAPRQIAAENGFVYVAARETGVWIVDARNPDKAKVLSRFDTIELATGMDVAGGVLFVGQRQNGVEFVDVRDPARPAHIRIEKTNESQSVVYRDGWLYSGDWGAGEITTIDAHDMATVKTVKLSPLKGHGDGVALFGNYLYAATGHHYHDKTRSKAENFGKGHGLEIFDVSNPAKPAFVSRLGFDAFYTLGADWWTPRPSADGKTVIVADTHNGVYAVDVAQPTRPRVIGRLTFPSASLAKEGKPSLAVGYVAVGNGAVYAATPQYGLAVVACSRAKAVVRDRGRAPAHPEYRIAYPTPATSRFAAWQPKLRGQLRGVAVRGECCYAACGHAGLAVLARKGERIVQVGGIERPFVGDVRIKGDLLYVAEGLDGVAVYSLADPRRPAFVKRQAKFGKNVPCALWVWAPAHAPYVIVSNRHGYLLLDEELNFLLKVDGHCPGWDRYIADDVVGGRWLAQNTANTGFEWIDLGGATPRVGEHMRKRNLTALNDGCLAFRGDRVLRMAKGTIQFLAPGQAANADGTDWTGVPVARAPERGVSGQPCWDGGNRLGVTARISKRISMVDISDESRPTCLWSEEIPGHPDTGTFWNGKLVVPAGYQGLLIEK